MRRELAYETAQWRANRYKEEYVAIRARNGQWMVETAEFLETPQGRLCYPEDRAREVFLPSR